MNIWPWGKKNASSNKLAQEDPKQALFRDDDHLIDKLAGNLEQNPRIIESQFGESFLQRGNLLHSLESVNLLGIGPPDMVHVTKFDKFRQLEAGEYHFLTGLDTSSEVTPIAYMNTLRLNEKTQVTSLASTGPSTRNRVTTYCTTNIFSKVDMRIRYESTSDFQVTVLDCNSGSTNAQPTQELWDETLVSGFIRAVIINNDKERKFPGLVELPMALENGLTYAEKLLSVVCRFLPRGRDVGCDLTKHTSASIKNNYLLDALISYLQVAKNLNVFVLEVLEELCISDPQNVICYSIASIVVLINSESHDTLAFRTINEIMLKLFPLGLTHLEQDQLTYAADMLNLETSLLLAKNDYELALPLAQKVTAICSDNFEALGHLARIYVHLEDYRSALLVINSLPSLLPRDPCKEAMWQMFADNGYYLKPLCSGPHSRLLSSEYNFISNTLKSVKDQDLSSMIFGRIVMPPQANRGCIKELWDGPCVSLGPIYGPQSKNLINFVSPEEVASLEDSVLLKRNSMAAQLNYSLATAYDLLMSIVTNIGWNSLLELRSSVFVMERERNQEYTEMLQPEFKAKRLCEKWLDHLFLELYEDLKITCDNESHRGEKFSGLEWEILGLTHLRTWNWQDAVACLRTSVMARFDLVSAEKLLDLSINYQPAVSKLLSSEVILPLLVEKISYESRFYNYLQLPNLRILAHLCALLGVENVRNHIYALPFAQRGIIALMDKLLSYIHELNE
ncbi:LADA_0C09890g1_1 [Lachancea dasiensis]|uniref:LADA_0C09890g1_1 n=1 Tax=Lachancea dasiensis TaxID=1072105 RepID=A0A1G4J0Q5_9SACH|nr:LADA_0C09890g1_1 [Lachancea dasiensis]